MVDKVFIQARIDKTKELIVAYEDAVLKLAQGTIQSYKFDTGQTEQEVTKLNINVLNKQIDLLYSRCATLENRLTGSGAILVRPAW